MAKERLHVANVVRVLEHGDGTVATMVFRPRTEAAARVKA